MISLDVFFVQSSMTGRIQCEYDPYLLLLRTPGRPPFPYVSVRAKIRDCVDGHNASSDFYLRCLYEEEKGDPERVEMGFLKSTLLIKV